MATDARDHGSVSELLGAWALNALPADEQRAVPAHLADCEECAAEAERLRATVRTLNVPPGPDSNGPGNGSTGHGTADGADLPLHTSGAPQGNAPDLPVHADGPPRRDPVGHPLHTSGAPQGNAPDLPVHADGPSRRDPAGHPLHTGGAPQVDAEGHPPLHTGNPAADLPLHADGPPRRDPAGAPVRGTGPLAAALAHRPPAPRGPGATAPHAQPYAATVAALQALLAEADGAWSTEVVHGWTVRDTVAHLIAADEPLAVHLGLPAHEPPAGAVEGSDWRTVWEARTRTVIAHERARDPHATVAVWHARAAELLAAPAARDPELAAQAATLMGARLPVAEHFLVRAFETWIHSHDIGRALDRPVPPPPAGHLWRLVRLAVRLLGRALGPQAPPVALTVTDASRTTEWVLGSEDEPVRAELALDPVDFCLLIGGRTAPDTLPPGTGDPAAARTLLDRAVQLAWL
ncbi:maleylpyruvate isomerase family mycothiol-dependent enzyme [Streptomyces sp. NPDC102360]|uniref:maleylpyruvate isomerase family mycothiol-dependent enzyme n=1 Tax=Streptomyces sp. NPDC102360 TaxID=3366160 RepID=UPI0038262FB5